jgi:hypothetical protein
MPPLALGQAKHPALPLPSCSPAATVLASPAAEPVILLRACALFAWLISHQPVVLLSQNKPATSNQSAVLSSQNEPAPATSQPNRLMTAMALSTWRAPPCLAASSSEATLQFHRVGRVLRSNGGGQGTAELAVCQPCRSTHRGSWSLTE